MPQIKPIVVRRRGKGEAQPENFSFTADMVPPSSSSLISTYRQASWTTFNNLPTPTMNEEAWRRTDLRNLQSASFKVPMQNSYLNLPPVPPDLLKPLTAETHGGQILLMPGGHQVFLNDEISHQGVIFTNLATAEMQYPQLVEKVLGKMIRPEEGKFAALTGAMAQDGIFLYIPSNVSVRQPLHSLVWGPGVGMAHFSHILVYLESSASATYVHESASPSEYGGQTLHAGIVELYVGPGASLRFIELQSWGEHVWNFSHERARIDRDGNIDWVFGAVGSHLTKNFTDLELAGEGSTGKMSGFYFADKDQHLDHDTQQNHLAPHSTSDLLFKGALLGESRSVWQGMIFVAPGAQKTDGYQANRNLVLSKKARADSIPGLEILADDVRCSHGATVGKIDQTLVFYLLSRGIPQLEAERLIVEGFFEPIMERIPYGGVRQRFQDAIHKKMEAFNHL